jgi:hypothetical protein
MADTGGSHFLGGRMMAAAKEGDVAALRRLIAEGGSELLDFFGAGTLDARLGNTPLHWAAARGHTEAVEALLEAGAPVEATNHGGSTPLQSAVLNGHADAARALRRRGADPTAPDEFGDSALDLARRSQVWSYELDGWVSSCELRRVWLGLELCAGWCMVGSRTSLSVGVSVYLPLSSAFVGGGWVWARRPSATDTARGPNPAPQPKRAGLRADRAARQLRDGRRGGGCDGEPDLQGGERATDSRGGRRRQRPL